MWSGQCCSRLAGARTHPAVCRGGTRQRSAACQTGDSSVRTWKLLPRTFHQRSKLSPGLLDLTLLTGLLTLGEPIDRAQAHSQGAQFLAVHPDDHDHIAVLHFDSLRNLHADAVRHVSPLAFKLGAANAARHRYESTLRSFPYCSGVRWTHLLPRPHALTLWSNPARAASSDWHRVTKLRRASRSANG